MRICSLLPSATEIVFALGLGESLRAVSHECDHPPEARAKPKAVRAKFDASALTGREIDAAVSEMQARGEPIYRIDEAVLRDAAPDIIITQQLCDVCAVSYEDVRHAAAQLDSPPRVISLDPASIDDILSDIRSLGGACGAPQAAADLAASLDVRIQAVRAAAANAIAQSSGPPPKVACIEWLDPLIAAGHWVPQMVEIAGGQDALAAPGAPSRRATLDELIAAAPDIVILMPCGMTVPQTIQEAARIPDPDAWRAIPAVANGAVFAADAGAYFSRSGPRLIDALEILAQIIHPQAFPAAPLPPNAARRLAAWPPPAV